MKPVEMESPDVTLTPPMIEQPCGCVKTEGKGLCSVWDDCPNCHGSGVVSVPDPNCSNLDVKVIEFTDGSRSVMSIWQPSDAERAALAAGGNLVVYVPMMPPPPFALGVISAMGVVIEE